MSREYFFNRSFASPLAPVVPTETPAKVDQIGFSKPEACDNPSRWSSARSARHHRNRSSKPIPRRGITLCATPDRGRQRRRLPSGGIACRLNHRLRLLHSFGMLGTRVKRVSQRFPTGRMKVARRFIAGLNWNRPMRPVVGTLERLLADEKKRKETGIFKRPDGTRPFSVIEPGNELPAYFRLSLRDKPIYRKYALERSQVVPAANEEQPWP